MVNPHPSMIKPDKRFLVGVGNWTMGDDSIGLRLVEHITQNGLDKGFEAIDLSGSGLRLLNFFGPETERILVIDSVFSDKAPGSYFLFRPDDVLSEKELSQFTTHESDLLKTIYMGQSLGYPIPNIRIMGIQPKRILQELNLSDELQANFSRYVQAAIETLMAPEF